MALESPSTYAEWYWSHSVDAQKLLAEDSEKVMAPYMADLLSDVRFMEETPEAIKSLIDAVTKPTDFAWAGALTGIGLNAVDEVLDVAFDPIITMMKRARKRATKETWLTSSEVNTLWARQKITEGLWDESVASEGYEEVLASSLYEAQLPYPTIDDFIRYSRYTTDYDNAYTEFQKWWNINAREWPVWEWLSLEKVTTEQAQRLFVRGNLSESDFRAEIGRIGWHAVDRDNIIDLAYQVPNAMLLIQAGLLQEVSNEVIIEDIKKADIHPDYAQKYLDAILTKPQSMDIIAYQLRKDPKLDKLPDELNKIGIHPNYHDLYKELAYQIPPVQDIITMAVREAFTPDIAQRFGQYEGLPAAYVEWVGKKGLSKEWAERYWAAHWSLPSVSQGFEMLHRNIITREDLSMLLRALDVMPFWRDKLIQMSYKPLTRVDVRRMYRVGTLDEAGIKKAYRDVGYADSNADLMADFTIKQTRQMLSGFSSRDVSNAYIKRFIDDNTARSLLREIGIRTEEIQNIITTSNYKREWANKSERENAIENLYKKGRLSESQARNQLDSIGLPSDHIDTLMKQWTARVDEPKEPTWTTAQTLKFLTTGLIDSKRAVSELQLLGYNDERISIYLKSIPEPTA